MGCYLVIALRLRDEKSVCPSAQDEESLHDFYNHPTHPLGIGGGGVLCGGERRRRGERASNADQVLGRGRRVFGVLSTFWEEDTPQSVTKGH